MKKEITNKTTNWNAVLNLVLIIIIIIGGLLFWTYIENHHIEVTVTHKIDLNQNDLTDDISNQVNKLKDYLKDMEIMLDDG